MILIFTGLASRLTLSVPVSYQHPFSPHITQYKFRYLVMRKWELIKESKLLKIKIKILLNFFNEKYGLKFGEFNNTTGTKRVKPRLIHNDIVQLRIVVNWYDKKRKIWSMSIPRVEGFLYFLKNSFFVLKVLQGDGRQITGGTLL